MAPASASPTAGRKKYCPYSAAPSGTRAACRSSRPEAVGTYVHELCHTYTNQVVDRHPAAFEKGAAAIYPLVATQMESMAYPSWHIMTYETLVRACVIRYLADRQGPQAAAGESERQSAQGFVLVPAVAVSLERFAAARDRYPTLDDFVPELARVMEGYATLAAQITARELAAPHIVSMVPANGAVDVDPALTTLVIRFDRPMTASSCAFVGRPDDIPTVARAPQWDDSVTSLTVEVQMTPGRTYHYWLNHGQNLGFRAADGTPLTPVEVRYTVADR
ncbi:MAG: DUF4932 domain-containing protein [bacterium]|nr:DUF4932 domain-containing protein [bacterium]